MTTRDQSKRLQLAGYPKSYPDLDGYLGEWGIDEKEMMEWLKPYIKNSLYRDEDNYDIESTEYGIRWDGDEWCIVGLHGSMYVTNTDLTEALVKAIECVLMNIKK